jgi:formylglycine-generating enzyme
VDLESLLNSYGQEGDADEFFRLAQQAEAEGSLDFAATAYDRAFGLKPDNVLISTARRKLLDQLSIDEHGLHFRYIPAGTFLMGSGSSEETDEQPQHPVRLDAFWLADVPISWERFARLMEFSPPPNIQTDQDWETRQDAKWLSKVKDLVSEPFRDTPYWSRSINVYPQMAVQYCENETLQARDWHAHFPAMEWQKRDGTKRTSQDVFGEVPRENPERPYGYDEKPLVAVSYTAAEALALRLSSDSIEYRLPTEAEWEKAARGGLIAAEYPWGNEPPTPEKADFGRFEEFSIRKSRSFPANPYGLYAMVGGVWEWTSDFYDAKSYSGTVDMNTAKERVIRGGSWADDAEALRLSFRASSRDTVAATIGFRLCRVIKR